MYLCQDRSQTNKIRQFVRQAEVYLIEDYIQQRRKEKSVCDKFLCNLSANDILSALT